MSNELSGFGRRLIVMLAMAAAWAAAAQPEFPFGPGGRGGPDGFGGPGGPGGGMGGGVQEDYPLLKKFDKNTDGWLNAEERQAARAFIEAEKQAGRGPRTPGPGGRGGRFGPPGEGPATAGAAGPKVKPSEVPSAGAANLYEPTVLRTLFLDFENPDWEKELAAFYRTDVEVPATLTVDGKTYRGVGVHFRGASSYFTVSEGRKRSLNVALDLVHQDQRLGGYRTLNLLNSHTDPSYLHTVLYMQVARDYLPAPKANFVRVVINGEGWGVYINVQQFNKDFLNEWFRTTKGARWKVPGSPRAGSSGLAYLGDDPAAYKKYYEIKSKDDPKAWAALIELCKLLKETPAEQLEKTLAPKLDLDGALKFLALENIFCNADGYWTRGSDYNLYLDEKGRFHILPHDANETFAEPRGPGMGGRGGGGGGGPGLSLHPLAGADDSSKPLLNKLLASPALKARYFSHVRAITERWLDWTKLGPVAQKYHALIAPEVKKETHALASYEAFERSLAADTVIPGGGEGRGRGPGMGGSMSLKKFVEARRAYLLALPEVKEAKPLK